MADWFVAQAARETSAAADELQERGHRCYQPRFRERVVVRGKKTWRERFLLGEYVLVEMRMKLCALHGVVSDWAAQFYEIKSVRGVLDILAVDGRPLLAREGEIQRLRNLEDKKGFVPDPNRFAGGDRVFVRSGVFADKFGTYKSSNNEFDFVEIEGLFAGTVKIPRSGTRAIAHA